MGPARNEAMLEEMVCEHSFYFCGVEIWGDFYLIEESDEMGCDVSDCTCVRHGICK